MSREFSTLRLTREGPIAEVTLTRTDILNRIDALAHRELVEVFRSLEDMEDLRAVVLASEGKVFSAGGDFEHMLAGNARLGTRQQMVDEAMRLLASLLDVVPPIVAAMHGDAIGLGATLVLACDAVVSHPTCRISDPHVNIGLVAGDGGCLVWPQSVGMLRAKRHLLTGDPLTATDAHAIGLVTDLVASAEEVLPAARALAERIAALPPIAVQGTKRALNAVLRLRCAEVMPVGLTHEVTSLGSDDLREAISSFKERRPPVYRGR